MDPRSSRAQPESRRTATVEELNAHLRESSRLGNEDLVQKLLNEGAHPLDRDDAGKTALHYAAEGADEDVARRVIERLLHDEKRASPKWEKASEGDEYGRNVLHIAAFLGQKELCRWLLRVNRNLIDIKDRDGQSAIFYAVAGPHDDPDVLQLFVSREQGTDQVFAEDCSKTTPLHVAAARGNRNMVEKLLSQISEEQRKDFIGLADVLGQTALHQAVSGGHVEVVKMLLKEGADPLKERDCDGRTALHFAAEANGEDAVKIAQLLLNKYESAKQKSLLLFASAVGTGLPNSSLYKYLESEKREIQKTLRQETLLQVAARLGYRDMTREFISRGAEETLVQVAARLGDRDMTREFISRGADINLLGAAHWRIHLAPQEENNVRSVLEQLRGSSVIEQGADQPALHDMLGRSPFAKGLAVLFLNPFVKSPITVGICGDWGMGKSSIMLQTERILLQTTAQLAFANPFTTENYLGTGERKLSVTGKAIRRKMINAIEKLRRWHHRPSLLERAVILIKELLQAPSVREYWNAPPKLERSSIVDEILQNYEPGYRHIYKFLAVMDRRDMFGGEPEFRIENEYLITVVPTQTTLPSILTVQYNAWHYRNETQAWAGLAVEITKELESAMTLPQKLRCSWMYNWIARRNSIYFGVMLPFILALVVAIWFGIIVWFLFDIAQRQDIKKFKYGGLPASIIVSAWGLGKSVLNFVKPISSTVGDYLSLPDHSQNFGYHQRVVDDINFLREQLYYRPSWKWNVFAFIWCCMTWSWDEQYVPGTMIPKMFPAFPDDLRIIIFIDDLDRCEEDVILQILSAINLVLASCEINVIMSMESSMIERAIIRKYGKGNAKSDGEIANRYLRKIVQLPIHLTDPSDSESDYFLQNQLGILSDGREGSTDPAAEIKKYYTYGRRKVNPKFQIGTLIPEKTKLLESSRFEEAGMIERDEAMIEIYERTYSEQSTRINEGDFVQMTGDLSIPFAVIYPKYSRGESEAFRFLHKQSSRGRKLPREWKCMKAYHRLAWSIYLLTPDAYPVEGWQVQLIAWIFVCWEWRDLITTLIQNWNNLWILRNWKEENSWPTLRDIVENYIDERLPTDKKTKHFNGDSSSNTEQVEKTGDNLQEKNTTTSSEEETKRDDYLEKILRDQEKMRDDLKQVQEALRNNLKEQEEMLKMMMNFFKEEEEKRRQSSLQRGARIMKKYLIEEEDNGESSMEPYARAEERKEWLRLRDTLRVYNVSMYGIQTFQKFRFYCEPGFLPWPLPKEA